MRIGAVRLLPRGVKKQDYARQDFFDVWLPILAPSRELLSGYKSGDVALADFFRQYRKEMREPDCRHTIALLAEVAQRTPISVGCYCEDEAACHRSVLAELIRQAAK